MNQSVKRRSQALHQTHHHYYLNISVEAANLSDWRIGKNRFGSENRIETFLPELECSSHWHQWILMLAGYISSSTSVGIVELCDYARIISRTIGDLPHNWANPA